MMVEFNGSGVGNVKGYLLPFLDKLHVGLSKRMPVCQFIEDIGFLPVRSATTIGSLRMW